MPSSPPRKEPVGRSLPARPVRPLIRSPRGLSNAQVCRACRNRRRPALSGHTTRGTRRRHIAKPPGPGDSDGTADGRERARGWALGGWLVAPFRAKGAARGGRRGGPCPPSWMQREPASGRGRRAGRPTPGPGAWRNLESPLVPRGGRSRLLDGTVGGWPDGASARGLVAVGKPWCPGGAGAIGISQDARPLCACRGGKD